MWMPMLIAIFKNPDCDVILRRVANKLTLDVNHSDNTSAENNYMHAFIDYKTGEICVLSISRITYWDEDRLFYNTEKAMTEYNTNIILDSLNIMQKILDIDDLIAVMITAVPSVRPAKTAIINYSIPDCLKEKDKTEYWKCLCAIWIRDIDALRIAAKFAPQIFNLNIVELTDMPDQATLSIETLCNRFKCTRIDYGTLVALATKCIEIIGQLEKIIF